MRRYLLVLGIIALAGLAKSQEGEGGSLRGAWEVTRFGEGPAPQGKLAVTFSDGKAAWSLDGRVFVEHAVTLDPGRNPRAIDLSLTDNSGKIATQQGIYRIDGDSVTVCMMTGPGRRPTEFKADKGTGNSLIVLKRHKP
jgi:uncharacterized protein (TIGR03067 family)